jgi:hypothetical protein
MIAIYLHLAATSSNSNETDPKKPKEGMGAIKVIGWLASLLGPEVTDQGAAISASSSASTSASTDAKAGPCFHEDGGRGAIFEAAVSLDSVDGAVAPPEHPFSKLFYLKYTHTHTPIHTFLLAQDPSLCQEVAPGILLGTTYIVVSCDCAKNRRLKDQSEWCEYCVCRKCGGKNLPKIISRPSSSSRGGGSSRGSDGEDDMSLDLLLFALWSAASIATVVYAGDRPYRYFYLVGYIAVATVSKSWLQLFNAILADAAKQAERPY